MADNYKYQRQNIGLAPTTDITFTNLAESLKGSARLEAALDRISNMAFKEVVEEQQKRGMQAGLDNAPTLDELIKANESGITPADLFYSDTTEFGKSARKVEAKLVRSEIEYTARKNFSAVKELINTGQITDIADLDSELNGIIEGNSKYLSGIDVEESIGLRSSLMTRGREIRQYGVGKIVEGQQKLWEQELEDFIQDTTRNWQDKIESMPIKDPSLFMSETMADATAIINKSGALGATKQAKTIERVKALQQDTMMSAITSYYGENSDFMKIPGKYLNDIQRGIVGEYTDMYNALTKENKIKLKKDLRELYKTKKADDEYALSVKTKDNMIEINDLRLTLNKTDNPQEKKRIIQRLESISKDNPDALNADDIEKIIKNQWEPSPEEEYSDASLKFKSRIINGEFTTVTEMMKQARNLGFSEAMIKKEFGPIYSSKEIANNKNSITEIATENISNKANANQRKKIELKIKQKKDAIKERDGENYNEDAANEEIRNALTNEKNQKRLNSALESLQEQFQSFTAISDFYNGDILNKNLRLDDPEVQEILRQIKDEDEMAYESILETLSEIEKYSKLVDEGN